VAAESVALCQLRLNPTMDFAADGTHTAGHASGSTGFSLHKPAVSAPLGTIDVRFVLLRRRRPDSLVTSTARSPLTGDRIPAIPYTGIHRRPVGKRPGISRPLYALDITARNVRLTSL